MPSIPPHTWQKSPFSPDGSDCIHLAATPAGTILLHESDEPGIVLTTGRPQLNALIAILESRNCDRV
ncbi:DUF397 domain-containing protein [Streptomyces sp. NPDC087263]|uniref:DUF397 domain-containing protein n=1 Tax=Streptomyces sp. NPDC087263 TaxID=3365773 RepID=UPI003803C696